MGIEETRGILAAYKLVKDASWPNMHPAMATRAAKWPIAPLPELEAELAGYLREASASSCTVRVFWKLGQELVFGGCNAHFATDAGFKSAQELVGIDDFDERLPWKAQAAKYRSDDKDVMDKGVANLDILERQGSAAGITWVRVGKAPIRAAGGVVFGVVGMYEVLDKEAGNKLYTQRSLKQG